MSDPCASDRARERSPSSWKPKEFGIEVSAALWAERKDVLRFTSSVRDGVYGLGKAYLYIDLSLSL